MRIHFVTLKGAIVNSLFKYLTLYSLAENIELAIELLTVFSGLTLFFFHLRPFEKINKYFSIYAIAGALFLVGFVIRGMFGGLIMALVMYPFIPNGKVYEKDGITLSTPPQHFIACCYNYQVKERKLLIFEKDHGIFELDAEGPIKAETLTIEKLETEIVLTYFTEHDGELLKERIIKR